MDLVGSKDWGDFQALFGTHAADTFAQYPIIWRRLVTNLDRWKEDNDEAVYSETNLVGLVNFNYMRSWPITKNDEAGELLEETIQVLFSKAYLQANGYLNENGIFAFEPDMDRFIIDGIIRMPVGDSSISQAQNQSMWYEVIMIEEPTPTGQART